MLAYFHSCILLHRFNLQQMHPQPWDSLPDRPCALCPLMPPWTTLGPFFPVSALTKPHKVLPEFPSVCTSQLLLPGPLRLPQLGTQMFIFCPPLQPINRESSPALDAPRASLLWETGRRGSMCVHLVEHLVYVRHYSKSIKGVKSLILKNSMAHRL